MKNKSIWEIQSRLNHADIAIIGGGVVGCTIAHLLSRSSIKKNRIFVFDKANVGAGASSKNDGQIIMGGCEHYNRMCETMGREEARAITHFKLESVKNIHSYDRNVGSLTWAYDKKEKEDLLESYELMKEDRLPVNIIKDHKSIKHYSGSQAFKLGLYYPLDKSLNPLKYLRDIQQKCREEGVKFINNREIARIEDGEYLVDNYENRIHFDICIIANNWSAVDLIPKLEDYIWSVRGQMLATEKVFPSDNAARYCHQTKNGFNYWKFFKDRIIMGGERTADEHTEETNEIGTNDKIQRALVEFIKEIYGIEPHIDYKWSGIMCNSSDCLPIIGSLNNMQNVILAVASNGYGMSYSYGMANAVKQILINGSYDEMELLGTRRFNL